MLIIGILVCIFFFALLLILALQNFLGMHYVLVYYFEVFCTQMSVILLDLIFAVMAVHLFKMEFRSTYILLKTGKNADLLFCHWPNDIINVF